MMRAFFFFLLTILVLGDLAMAAPSKKQKPSPSTLSKVAAPSKTAQVTPVLNSNYALLMEPLNIYAPPKGAKKLVTLKELYELVNSRGVALKVARETYSASKQSVYTTEDRRLPVLSLDLSHDQKWSKTKTDSDPTDTYQDRNAEVGSRNLSSAAGFSLNGAPLSGVTYKISFPQLTNSKTIPDDTEYNPYRPDSGGYTASLSVALLKDSPFFVESATRRKSRIQLASAKDALKQESIRKIAEAVASYYSLARKYLNLAIQERSLKLAEALVNDVKEKVSAGESSPLELTRANLQKAQSETEYMSSQIEYEGAVEEFRRSLALDDKDGQGVFPDPKSLDINVDRLKVPQNAFDLLKKSNPDIVVARNSRELAVLDLDLARKATYPSLGVNLSYGNRAPELGWQNATREGLKPNDRVFSVGLTYSHILYNNSAKNDLKSSLVAKQKADLAVDEAERKSLKEFNALLKRIDIGSRRYEIAKTSREIAEEKLQSEYERFKAGESSVRNVIDSQTEVNNARISEIGSRVDLVAAYSDMNALLGLLPEGVTLSY